MMGTTALRRPGKLLSKLLGLCFYAWMFNGSLQAQTFLQNVKGTIRDQETRQPIEGVALLFSNQSNSYAAFSNTEGDFRIKIPSGRWNLRVTRLGYGSKSIPNIQVGTGKEVMLEIELEAKVFQTEEVQVSAGKRAGSHPTADPV